MRRIAITTALSALLWIGATGAPAQELGLGDPVTEVNIEKFFQGDAFTSFSKEKTYVLEFWATR